MFFSKKQKYSLKNSTKKLNIWDGSVRSGKTWITLFKWFYFVCQNRNKKGELVMIGLTAGTLYRNVILPMMELFGKLVTYSSSKNRVYIAGKEIHCLGANDRRSEGFIRGITLVGLLGDEVTLWNEELFNRCYDRLSAVGAQAFLTTNPDSPNHWLKKNFIDNSKMQKYVAHFTFKLRDNEWLVKENPGYIESIEQAFTGLWYKRYILGIWAVAAGLVYDFWDDESQLLTYEEEQLKEFENYYISCDYGTANPCVFLLWGEIYNPYTGESKYYCLNEYYYSGKEENKSKTDAEYSQDMTLFIQDSKDYGYNIKENPEIIVDPSALSFITQLENDGFYVTAANNDVKNGIVLYSRLLKNGTLKIHRIADGPENLQVSYGTIQILRPKD